MCKMYRVFNIVNLFLGSYFVGRLVYGFLDICIRVVFVVSFGEVEDGV